MLTKHVATTQYDACSRVRGATERRGGRYQPAAHFSFACFSFRIWIFNTGLLFQSTTTHTNGTRVEGYCQTRIAAASGGDDLATKRVAPRAVNYEQPPPIDHQTV